MGVDFKAPTAVGADPVVTARELTPKKGDTRRWVVVVDMGASHYQRYVCWWLDGSFEIQGSGRYTDNLVRAQEILRERFAEFGTR